MSNTKSAIIALAVSACCAPIFAKNAEQTVGSKGLSLGMPIVFDKETLRQEAHQNVQTPILKSSQTLSKAERKVLRKELEKLVHRKDAKSLSFDELRKAANLSMQIGWHDKALVYLKEMVASTKDSEAIKKLKLEIADVLFEKGLLAKAGQAFEEYLALYPGSDQSEYAHYKMVLCTFYQTLKTDQDQDATKEAIRLAQNYLEKGLAYKAYRSEIVQIRQHCQFMLYENELNVFNFYMKKKSYGAASGRLAYLKKQYLPKLPTIEANLIDLECKLALAQGNKALHQERLAYLHKKFPGFGKPVRVAQRTKKGYTERF